MADTKLDKQLKLSGALPGEDRENGLDHLAPAIVDDPEGTLVFALVVLDTRSVTHDVLSGVDVPMLRIREVEGVMLDDVPGEVRNYMESLRVQRRGAEQDPLPEDEPLLDHLDATTVAIVPADEDAVIFNPFQQRGGRR